MNIDKIALFLTGNFPSHYRAPFNKVKFLRTIESESPEAFGKDMYSLVNSDTFYADCLRTVEETDKKSLAKIVKILDIPEDTGGLSAKDKIADKLENLKKEYEEMRAMPDEKATVRGNRFEEIVCEMFDIFDLKTRDPDKTGRDRFDGAFELDGTNYLIESKWSEKADKNDAGNFSSKIGRKLFGTLGLLVIDMEKFKQKKLTNILDVSSEDKNFLIMRSKDMEKVLNNEILLPDLIRTIKRRGAEENKPYLED